MGRLAKALYPKDNPQALSLLKLCAIGVGRRLARNSGAMGVEIIYFVKILRDTENPYREISVSLHFQEVSGVLFVAFTKLARLMTESPLLFR